LEELDLPVLQKPIRQTLKELKGELESKVEQVNHRISSRENKDIKFNNRANSVIDLGTLQLIKNLVI